MSLEDPGWGCCLCFAYFLPNFSLVLLIKSLLIKEKACSIEYFKGRIAHHETNVLRGNRRLIKSYVEPMYVCRKRVLISKDSCND